MCIFKYLIKTLCHRVLYKSVVAVIVNNLAAECQCQSKAWMKKEGYANDNKDSVLALIEAVMANVTSLEIEVRKKVVIIVASGKLCSFYPFPTVTNCNVNFSCGEQ